MHKIAILGCENSHADNFLGIIKNSYTDIDVLGVYSYDEEASKRLNEKYGVYIAKSYDEFVGKVDGIIITARDGRNHYKYAKPYIKSGIPMFVDKPITSDEVEAVEFMKELRDNGCRVSGGSSCVHAPLVKELAEKLAEKSPEKVYGGFLRAPISLVNDYGNFFFYSQHLVQVMQTIYGYYPKSVKAYQNGNVLSVTVRYENYDVALQYTDGDWRYVATLSYEKNFEGGLYSVGPDESNAEFAEFYNILTGGEQHQSYRDFIAPVAVLCAIDRSMRSGNEELVNPVEEI